MKILFVANRAEFGGAPKCMMELIDILTVKYGVEVEVLTHGENDITAWCKERNIVSYAVGHVPFAIGKGSTPFRRFAKMLLTPYFFLNSQRKNKKAFERACQMIDFSDVDIIHTNSNRDCIGAMLSEKYKIPHVWHLREFGKEDYDIRYLKWRYISFMNETTTAFIAISDAVKKVWIKKGIPKEKIFRIYDGIHLPAEDIVNKAKEHQEAKKDDILTFAYLGMVCPSKGQFEAIKGLAKVDKKIQENIKIDFWGDCNALPEHIAQMTRFAEKEGIGECVNFCGLTNDIWNVLPEYDAAMVCSRSEAFGRITPEYMSLGLQTIVSDTGANPELVEAGVSGYIYEKGNVHALAEKIEKIYHCSKEEKKVIAQQAKDRASMFSDDEHAKRVYAFYNELLK